MPGKQDLAKDLRSFCFEEEKGECVYLRKATEPAENCVFCPIQWP